MKEKDHSSDLCLFKKEVKALSEPYFADVDKWRLDEELLNGVLVGRAIEDSCA